MGQIPRSIERISSYFKNCLIDFLLYTGTATSWPPMLKLSRPTNFCIQYWCPSSKICPLRRPLTKSQL